MNENKVIVQKWEEVERGHGTRPDGFSLHLYEEDRKSYIRAYWERVEELAPDLDEYSRPHGTPYSAEVDDATFTEVKDSKRGTRDYGRPPGSGGNDGWIPD